MTLAPTPQSRSFAPGWRFAIVAVAAAAAATAALAQPPAQTAPQPAAAPPPEAPAQPSATPAPAEPPAQASAAPAATPPADFAVCAACHEVTAEAGPSLGPNLFNVGGRKAGAVADYDYSPAMKASGVTWTAETLQAFIADPTKVVPGNKMDYPGTNDAAAKAIADYLMSLKG